MHAVSVMLALPLDPAPSSRPRVVLIVDDDEDTRTVFAEVLRGFGFTTVDASDGERALELAIATLPDAILLDQSMPFMGGDETARRLRSDPRTREIPILMVTGFCLVDLATSAQSGVRMCDDYLEKACAPRELVEHVRELLRAHEVLFDGIEE